jgi:threonyl-tRNA synthetase
MWIKTEEMVRNAMLKNNIPFVEIADEAAFYGPKIDVQVKSAIGREFTLATNQVDFAQADSFDLVYTNEQGQEERPVIIHRAPLSTHERMIGFLLEHYAGTFPLWLSPEQVRVIPITDEVNQAAQDVYNRLHDAGIRAEVDLGSDRMNAKIRQAQLMKVPYMAVMGKREVENGQVALRKRDGTQESLSIEEFVNRVVEKNKVRDAEL